MPVDGPLSNLRIFEVGHMLAGPYCGMLLADLGAEVIKVEHPPAGDIARAIATDQVAGQTVYFASLNRSKRSVALDLGDPDDRAAFDGLVATDNGLVTNLRPSAICKLGLAYAELSAIGPRIACLALTGFGMEVRDAERPAYDYIAQARMGLMNLTGDPDTPPTKTGYSVVDNSSGIMGAFALVSMIQSGRGGQVDVSLYDTMLSQMNYIAGAYLNSGTPPGRVASGGHPFLVPAQIFATADGHVSIFISRFEHREEVLSALSELFLSRPSRDRVVLLEPLDIVIAEVSALQEALDGPLVTEREMVVTTPRDGVAFRLVGSPVKVAGWRPRYAVAPDLGADNAALCAQSPGRGSNG